jgi:acylphosphatase
MTDKQIAKTCVHCYISGCVQGVGFRYYTRKQAIKYGINGWVRNLVNGTVEVLACGFKDNIEQFIFCLKQGPINARVDEIISTEQSWQEFADFSIV